MTIIRGPYPTSDFTTFYNSTLEDSRLSWKARGLLCYLLSKPEDWQVNIKHLAGQAPDGGTAVETGLRELQDAGYLVRERKRLIDGKFDWECRVYMKPLVEPQPDYPVLDEPLLDNRPLVSNEETRTEKTKGLFPSLEAVFEVGWSKYPRKVDKGDALKQFKKTVKEHGVDPVTLADCMAKYGAQCQRNEIAKEFIKHGKTFFGPKLSWQEFMPENDTLVRTTFAGGYYEEDGRFFYSDGTETDEDSWQLSREAEAARNDPNINKWSGQ